MLPKLRINSLPLTMHLHPDRRALEILVNELSKLLKLRNPQELGCKCAVKKRILGCGGQLFELSLTFSDLVGGRLNKSDKKYDLFNGLNPVDFYDVHLEFVLEQHVFD